MAELLGFAVLVVLVAAVGWLLVAGDRGQDFTDDRGDQ